MGHIQEEHEVCNCGQEHGQHHEHEHDHHEHDHHHEHEGCGCGHDHVQDAAAGDRFSHIKPDVKQTVYIMENLGCANCAAKMEQKINELPQVEAATLTFATKQLRVASNHQEQLLPILQEICSSIESEVIVRPKDEQQKSEKASVEEGN